MTVEMLLDAVLDYAPPEKGQPRRVRMPQVLETKTSIRENLEQFVLECIQTGVHFRDALQQVEMEYVMSVLAQTNYNVSKASSVLGINRNTLSKKIEQYQQFERFRQHQRLYVSR